MSAIIDYFQIQEDLQTLLIAGPTGGYTKAPKKVFIEAMDREATFDNMPFINIRMDDGTMEVRSLPNGYYGFINLKIDVISFDLSLLKKATNVRDDIMGEAQKAIQENPRFNGDVETCSIAGPINFGAGATEGAGGHVSAATFTVVCEIFVEPA